MGFCWNDRCVNIQPMWKAGQYSAEWSDCPVVTVGKSQPGEFNWKHPFFSPETLQNKYHLPIHFIYFTGHLCLLAAVEFLGGPTSRRSWVERGTSAFKNSPLPSLSTYPTWLGYWEARQLSSRGLIWLKGPQFLIPKSTCTMHRFPSCSALLKCHFYAVTVIHAFGS